MGKGRKVKITIETSDGITVRTTMTRPKQALKQMKKMFPEIFERPKSFYKGF